MAAEGAAGATVVGPLHCAIAGCRSLAENKLGPRGLAEPFRFSRLPKQKARIAPLGGGEAAAAGRQQRGQLPAQACLGSGLFWEQCEQHMWGSWWLWGLHQHKRFFSLVYAGGLWVIYTPDGGSCWLTTRAGGRCFTRLGARGPPQTSSRGGDAEPNLHRGVGVHRTNSLKRSGGG